MLTTIIDLIKIIYEVVMYPWVLAIVAFLVLIVGALYMHFKQEIQAFIAKIKGEL